MDDDNNNDMHKTNKLINPIFHDIGDDDQIQVDEVKANLEGRSFEDKIQA